MRSNQETGRPAPGLDAAATSRCPASDNPDPRENNSGTLPLTRDGGRSDSGGVLADLEGGEEAIALVELRDQPFMPRRHGKKLDRSVVFRWAKAGIGGVRLETARAGVLITTKSAALRFFARLSGERPPARSPGTRDRRVRQAERELERMGMR